MRETFQRLIQEKQLVTYRYDGFFAAMDTFKDKQNLDELYTRGKASWLVWKAQVKGNGAPPAASVGSEKKVLPEHV